MKSIDNLKIVLLFAINLTSEVDVALADGKWSLGETVRLLPDLLQIPSITKAAKEIPAELSDLSEAERAELIEFVRTKLDLAHDQVEAIVEKAFAVLLDVFGLAQAIRQATTKTT